MSYRSFFSTLAGFAMNWLYWLSLRDTFGGIVEGMRWVGIGCGIVLALASMVPALFVEEIHIPKPEELPGRDKGWGFAASVKGTLSTRPFLLVIAACVCVIVGVLSVMQVGMYLNIFYVAAGDQKLASTIQGIAGSCYQVTALLTVPAVSWLGVRLGKRRALMAILSLGVVGSLSSWFTFTPAMPYLQIASLFFSAPAITGLWILAPAMLADVCDYDDDRSGIRREGMFGAAYGWFTKIGGSLALLVSGFLLVRTGFEVNLGAAQGPATFLAMRVLNATLPAVFFAAAIAAIARYPITEQMARDIRRRLDRSLPGSRTS
jgi:GPH family glycoside/pentoside/hexuronide:cation symporter